MERRLRARLGMALLLVFAAFGMLPRPMAAAQSPQPTPSDDEVNRVAKSLYCPVCENIPLDVCPTTACQEWRELIRQKLGEGMTDEQIKDYFALQYGDRVLSAPPPSGLNLLVYIIPPLAIAGGAVMLYRVLRKGKRRVPPAGDGVRIGERGDDKDRTAVSAAEEDLYLQQAEEELKRKEDLR